MSVERTRLLSSSRHRTGTLNHVSELATPEDRAIVAPNNDTLYSSGWYDLRHGDLLIDVPPMDKADRYWNVMVVDAYTHVAYVARRHHGVDGVSVRVTFDPAKEPKDDGRKTLRVGTAQVWVIVRVLVESREDLDVARGLQNAIGVTPPEAHPHVLTERAGRAVDIGKAGADFFAELQAFVGQNPPAPWHPNLSEAGLAILNDPTIVSEEELEAGVREGERLLKAGNASGTVVKNGWSTGRSAQGPGGDILKRAIGAKFGLGGHYAIENRSYIAIHDANGSALNGTTTLYIRFKADDMPPCTGFWSLTAYGMDLYLVENELNRWSISDRTPGLLFDNDGSLTIQLSATHPENVANWLPVPKGPYMLGMRVYEGRQPVVECSWFPPALETD